MTVGPLAGGDGAMAEIREGMPVVDRAGVRLGTVEYVRMGDPEAVTSSGQGARLPDDALGRLAGGVFGREPKLPDELSEKLARLGFVKIDGKGFLDRDCYASSRQVAGVSDETVQLNVEGADLVAEVT